MLSLLDPQADLKLATASYCSRKHFWVGMQKCETEIPKNENLTSPSIKRTQVFPLALAWAPTLYKVSSLRLVQGVANLESKKQKSFWAGPNIYCTL